MARLCASSIEAQTNSFHPAITIRNTVETAELTPRTSANDVRITLTTAAHLIASHPQINLGCEFYMPQFVFDPEELETSLTVEDGHVFVPFGHGLGIDVNEDILDAMAVEELTFS